MKNVLACAAIALCATLADYSPAQADGCLRGTNCRTMSFPTRIAPVVQTHVPRVRRKVYACISEASWQAWRARLGGGNCWWRASTRGNAKYSQRITSRCGWIYGDYAGQVFGHNDPLGNHYVFVTR